MPITKVRVVVEFKEPFLAEILPLGYETEIEPILSTVEKVVVRDWYIHKWNKITNLMEHFLLAPKVVAPIGSYEGYRFVGANGLVYCDKHLGFLTLEKVFKKIS